MKKLEIYLFKEAQHEKFSARKIMLQKKESAQKSSFLQKLTLDLDKESVLRAQTRIELAANTNFEQKIQ